MTGRERFMKLLNGEKIDRIPVAPFIFYNLIDEFYSRAETHSLDRGTGAVDYVEKGIELYDYFGFDIILRTANIFEYLRESPDKDGNWKVTEKREGSDADWAVKTEIKTPEKKLSQVKKYHKASAYEVVEAVTEYFIKDENDFEQFVKYQPPLPDYATEHITKARRLLGERGLVAPWAQGAFNSASFYRDVASLLMDAYTEPDFYKRQIEYFSGRMFELIRQMAYAGADIVCCGGNVANGTTAGPVFFDENVLPYETRFTAKVKELGVFYLYHNCGDAKSLYSLYSSMGMNIFETLTAPPAADNDLNLAFETFDSRIILSGGIDQINFLIRATPAEVRKKVKEILLLAKTYGNFILAASDYFSEGTPYDNLKAFAEAGKEFGHL